MAKQSMIEREKKRTQLSDKYKAKRDALKGVMKSPSSSEEEVWDAMMALQKLPRDSAGVRKHNRCKLTGRPHGYYRKFGLCRNKLREACMNGDVPGLKLASW